MIKKQLKDKNVKIVIKGESEKNTTQCNLMAKGIAEFNERFAYNISEVPVTLMISLFSSEDELLGEAEVDMIKENMLLYGKKDRSKIVSLFNGV